MSSHRFGSRSANGHFIIHLCIRGFTGDLSISIATNDVIFWIFHQYLDHIGSKYHLSLDDLLVPQTYNMGFKIINEKQQVVLIDIEKDSLTYYENISVKEAFQVGYDDFCFIHDQMALPINQILKSQKPPQPVAFQRLKNQLPSPLLEKYFPKIRAKPKKFNIFRLYFRQCCRSILIPIADLCQ